MPGHDISAFIDPVTALTMSQIPAANLPVNQYSDSSHGGTLVDTNMAQRIDFINHMTGDWSFYYHYDDATATQPVYQQAYMGITNVPGLSGDGAVAQPAVLDEQHKDLRCYRGQRCAPAVFPHSSSNRAAGGQFDDFRLRQIRLQYRSRRPVV